MSEKTFTDIYYDTNDYKLTAQDIWLRERDGQLELKIPLHGGVDRKTDQYNEIEDETEITERLRLPSDGDLKEVLAKNGYQLFCTCTTTRMKYKKDSLIIDLDFVDYGDFIYTLGEIELMVGNKSEIDKAVSSILDFASQNQLVVGQVRGKVIEYLKQKRPSHYQVLTQKGVVKEF